MQDYMAFHVEGLDVDWLERVLDCSWREAIKEVRPSAINDIYFNNGVRITFVDSVKAIVGQMKTDFYVKASGCCDRGRQTIQGQGYCEDWIDDGFFEVKPFKNNGKSEWLVPTDKAIKVVNIYREKVNKYMKNPADLVLEKPWGVELIVALHDKRAKQYEKEDTKQESMEMIKKVAKATGATVVVLALFVSIIFTPARGIADSEKGDKDLRDLLNKQVVCVIN